MARAQAETVGDLSIQDWAHRHDGQHPDQPTQTALRAIARSQALNQVLSTELYELIDDDF